MQNVTPLRKLAAETAPRELYLGPAQVIAAGCALEVELADGRRVAAQPALAFAYEPAPGDSVLVLGKEQHYVVGVLATQGKAVIAFPGDLELRAAGKLRLSGEQGMALEAPTLDIQVGKLEMAARHVAQRFISLTQRVSELWSTHAGSTQTVVDGASYTRADSATLLTKNNVSINGKAIHLG